jgi:4-hydroxy-tetrahydrodipicolinate synthase
MASPLTLRGTLPALVTPFVPSGEAIDEAAYEALIEAQIAGGVSGLVPCGTTGEAPTLTDVEQTQLIERAVAISRGRVPVIAGAGSFSTQKTIEAARRAFAAGADAAMIVMPYYSKPTQEGLYQHLVAVAKAVQGPIVLYNVPSRTHCDLAADTTERVCASAPNVIAIKDATGNVLRCQELKRRLGDRLTVLSGDDALTPAMIAVGAEGVISVTCNVYPAAVSHATSLALAGRFAEARAAHYSLLPVHEAMFVEANPGPVKAALAARGVMSPALRLPLVPLTDAARGRLVEALARFEANA